MRVEVDRPQLTPTPTQLSDVTVDDSDKTQVVPAGKIWQVMWIRYELTATATVGTRTPEIELRDDADDVLYSVAGATVTASQSSTQQALPGAGGDLVLPLDLRLLSGYDIRVADTAAIDAAADDLVVHIMIVEWNN